MFVRSVKSMAKNRWRVTLAVALLILVATVYFFVQSERRLMHSIEKCAVRINYNPSRLHPSIDWLFPVPLNKQVNAICFDGCKDTASIVPLLPQLSSIEYLYFNDTDISDRDLKYIAQLPKLRTLMLDGTEVTDDGLLHLSDLKLLRMLGTLNTQVTFTGLKRLESKTQITGPCHTRAFQELEAAGILVHRNSLLRNKISYLRYLQVDFERLMESDFSENVGLMRRLDCATSVGISIDRELSPLSCMARSGPATASRQTVVCEQLCRSLAQLDHVDHVKFKGVPVTAEAMKQLSELQGIKHLSIKDSGEPITEMGLAHVSAHKELLSLEIDNIMASQTGYKSLSECRKLMTLKLQGDIPAAGLEHLSRLGELVHLWLVASRTHRRTFAGQTEFEEQLVKVLQQCELSTLCIRNEALSESTFEEIGKSRSLTGLITNCPNLTSSKVLAISNLQEYQFVSFDGSNLQRRHIDELMQLPVNTNLSIDDTPLWKEGELALKPLRQRFQLWPKPDALRSSD